MDLTESIVKTLAELGDEVSRNLSFSYQDAVSVSYGEETITESCLLSLKRKHPKAVNIESFSKTKESYITGADWEWHFVGTQLVASYRVQAKRVSRKGTISGIQRKAKTATTAQADLLISNALSQNMIPLHCFYCAEQHRTHWVTTKRQKLKAKPLLTGCLIARAETVRQVHPTRLDQIESKTVPWHFLLSPALLWRQDALLEKRFANQILDFTIITEILEEEPAHEAIDRSLRLPNLNRSQDGDLAIGIQHIENYHNRREELGRSAAERGVTRIIEVNVEEIDLLQR